MVTNGFGLNGPEKHWRGDNSLPCSFLLPTVSVMPFNLAIQGTKAAIVEK